MQSWSKTLILSVFLVLITYTPTTIAQVDSDGITASINKSTYKTGEKVTITGTVKDGNFGTPVTILIRNPIQNVYDVGQVDLQNDIFVHSFVISDNSKPGIYTVTIKHGNQSTKLQFTVSTGLLQNIPVDGSTIKVRGDELGLIKYRNAQVSTEDNTITINLESVTGLDHNIMQEFAIPKEVINAPETLTVEINGAILQCSETEAGSSRILNCIIPPSAREMKLIGTSVIPEFGQLAAWILIIGISSIIIFSSKTKPRQHFY